ncbi:thioredoxin domain-containing protein [Microvirga sp. W0021]|uniref:Thioredoxin domain-containing protein n=1 Tax=Hohaiivirga grylli TaxID=3133970 RepID=A0ABV0BFK0_9HYPH
MNLSRRSLLLTMASAGVVGLPGQVVAQSAPEGEMVPIELFQDAQELDGLVRLGHPHGYVIMMEFFDYNCPWCKRSANDLEALLKAESEVSYILVNFAILGAESVQATKIALAFRELMGSDKYLPLHLALFKLKGTVNGERAIAEAVKLGANQEKLLEIANSQKIINQMTAALRVGNSLGINVTPSYILGNTSYAGGITLPEKLKIIAKAREG